MIGCAKPDATVLDSVSRGAPRELDPLSHPIVEDLGELVACGQSIAHTFEWKNPLVEPVHILSAEPERPCCSSIALTSKEIQPGSTASIPVTIKPGLGSGDHRFGFQVGYRTSRGRSHTRFYLKCKLRPEWEIKRLGEIDPTVRLGNTAVFRYEIICRKLGLEGRLCPDRIEAEQPLQADFDAPCSPGEEQRASTATPIIIEVRRRFHVVVPGEAPKNGRAPLIKLSWNDSPPIEHPVPYRISRPIHWNPRALVIQREEFATAVEITLESLDLAFRVTGVDAHPLMGPASYSMEPSRKQTIRIETRDRGEGPRISSLVIRLDHPEQSEVSIPVLFQ